MSTEPDKKGRWPKKEGKREINLVANKEKWQERRYKGDHKVGLLRKRSFRQLRKNLCGSHYKDSDKKY